LRRGRSIDSPKRRNGHEARRFGDGPDSFWESLQDSSSAVSVLAIVVVRDIVAALRQRLTPAEREILACLADGLGTRETARCLNLSHTCVAKKRRRIAEMVRELQGEPYTKGRAKANGENEGASRPSRFQSAARITSVGIPKNGVGRATINTYDHDKSI